ncbi:ketopantoate reductase family protein [Methylotenera sp.]|uniref:ketopantoate reductase family protein n=1 Tax=Methylotenera sp. TaxID=2051956 RepID=UPI00271669DC|nr:ketopantoate reductase family protein [Methylotenera sp.]MDO9206593.1 ketopantoate reductase family protein [Methylotenera sp.]MDP3330817.1 ketopantoate reductase family protein [Methylococcaceae bacterium]MDP3817533.1 ketopantoate reductase family protein [Methylotenera sp.]
MRILILGAGGVGGYFGARIHRAGGDVTFLVRPARVRNLKENGLLVSSPLGDIHIQPKYITSLQGGESRKFDVIIVSCKAYDLDSAIDAIAPALASQGIVVPLLNGMAHLQRLDERFGRERVLGGIAHLGVTLTPEGNILHLNELHRLMIGSRTEFASPLVAALAEVLASSGIDFALSRKIEAEMWDKFIFLSTLAGATCTMRAAIGDILQTRSGEAFILGLLGECLAVAGKYGYQPSDERLAQYRLQLTTPGSTSTASMLRDIERRGCTEAEHIFGDMVIRAQSHNIDASLLQLAYSHLQAYEIRRTREQT